MFFRETALLILQTINKALQDYLRFAVYIVRPYPVSCKAYERRGYDNSGNAAK